MEVGRQLDEQPSNKKIIFVGGTAYSGSTLLDMILANDNRGLSCGELVSFYHPTLPYHLNPVCGCGNIDCEWWLDRTSKSLHPHEDLLSRSAEVDFIVDSSKFIPWILTNEKRLKDSGYEVRHVLIWKSPEQYYSSRKKRGELRGWARSWIEYHRDYLHFIRPDVVISYSDLVAAPQVLEKACSLLNISYFKGKELYWNREQHTLFGNSSAKIHLFDSNAKEFNEMASELESIGSTNAHRKLLFEQFHADSISHYSRSELDSMSEIVRILVDSPRLEMNKTIQTRLCSDISLKRQRFAQWMREFRLNALPRKHSGF